MSKATNSQTSQSSQSQTFLATKEDLFSLIDDLSDGSQNLLRKLAHHSYGFKTSISFIAKQIGKCVRIAWYRIEALVKTGYIEVKNTVRENGSCGENIYYLTEKAMKLYPFYKDKMKHKRGSKKEKRSKKSIKLDHATSCIQTKGAMLLSNDRIEKTTLESSPIKKTYFKDKNVCLKGWQITDELHLYDRNVKKFINFTPANRFWELFIKEAGEDKTKRFVDHLKKAYGYLEFNPDSLVRAYHNLNAEGWI
jgi:hypothetical protein